MQRITNRTIVIISGLLMGTGWGASWVRARTVELERAAVCGKYSPAEVLAWSDRIARQVAPEARLDAAEVCFQGVSAESRKPLREWIVEYS